MCRLYAFSSTEPTKVECTLVHAQNALLSQSEGDMAGDTHSEGWGIATYLDGPPQIERQAWAAHHGERFLDAAAKIYAKTVVAHIRKASVGMPSLENTHPFRFEKWVFAHNGTLSNFDAVRPKLLAETDKVHADRIAGQTDSEHIFAYFLTCLDKAADRPPEQVLKSVVKRLEALVRETGSNDRPGLNLVLSNGYQTFGTRSGRTLHCVVRPGVQDCEICGFPHVRHHPEVQYWAAVVASEPLTHERWEEIPDRSVWFMDAEMKTLRINPLD